MKARFSHQQGFSLTELIVVVAVVGVLGAVALPSYGNYTRRTQAAEGLILVQPTLMKVREEVAYGDYTTGFKVLGGSSRPPGSPAPGKRPDAPPDQVPNLSLMVKNIVRHDLTVVINYTCEFDPEKQKEYSLVMVGTLNGDAVNWQCKSGPAADEALSMANAYGVKVGEALPTHWAPNGC